MAYASDVIMSKSADFIYSLVTKDTLNMCTPRPGVMAGLIKPIYELALFQKVYVLSENS